MKAVDVPHVPLPAPMIPTLPEGSPVQSTFRCTSLRIRYSAERSKQTLRLGGTLTELKISGEKLGGHKAG